MDKYIAVFLNDMKNTRRDPTLYLMLWLPLLMLAVLRFGLPPLMELFPLLAEYDQLFVIFFTLLCAMFPSYIISFMLLDEKDQHVVTAIRTTPLNPAGYFAARMFFLFLFGLVNGTILLLFNGIVVVPIMKSLLIAFICSISSPFFVFITISFAKNKIEGATIMKVLNILLMLPIIAMFVDHPTVFLLGILPYFWIFKSFYVIDQPMIFLVYSGIGITIAALMNYLLYKLALSRFYR
jgi:fluoroquinolone transport system permease protein